MTLQCATIRDAYSADKGPFTDCLRFSAVETFAPGSCFNQLPGRSLFALQHDAELCIAQSRKSHARISLTCF
jgi:hypothetical protein